MCSTNYWGQNNLIDFLDFLDINCDPNPCLHNGTCEGGKDSYNCTCAPGWSGATCEISNSLRYQSL